MKMNTLKKFHQDQQGAIALAVMAALLIIFMLSLVIFDATFVSRQKVEVQAAADSAAWSQSAVESRSMNMIAFANIGKRITVGMTVFYEALWAGWASLFALTLLVTIALLVVCIASWGSVCTPFQESLKVLIDIGFVMAQEATDLGKFLNTVKDYMKNDTKAFDNYQVYMAKITPWWGWAEAWIRGARNGALAVGTFPVPKDLLSEVGAGDLPAGLGGSGIVDSLPIEKDDNFQQLCRRAMVPDLIAHGLDYTAKTLTCGNDCLQSKTNAIIPRIALYAIAGAFAAVWYWANCEGFANATFDDEGKPFQMKEFGNQADWLLASSNMVISYRPGRDLSGEMRNKYRFIDKDYTSFGSVIYDADGQFGMSRSEISYQGEGDIAAPDLWHAAYSARMRPLAFPGEWAAYSSGATVPKAVSDALPYMAGGSLLGFLGVGPDGAAGAGPDIADFARLLLAAQGLSNDNVDGLPR